MANAAHLCPVHCRKEGKRPEAQLTQSQDLRDDQELCLAPRSWAGAQGLPLGGQLGCVWLGVCAQALKGQIAADSWDVPVFFSSGIQ